MGWMQTVIKMLEKFEPREPEIVTVEVAPTGIPIFPHIGWVQKEPVTQDDVDYALYCMNELDILLHMYGARIGQSFINCKTLGVVDDGWVNWCMNKWGEGLAVDEVKTRDFTQPSCQWGMDLIDYEFSETSYPLRKNNNVTESTKHEYINHGIVFAKRPWIKGLMTHRRCTMIWQDQLGALYRRPREIAKLLLHELLHEFGAAHGDNDQVEQGTALGNSMPVPNVLCDYHKDQLEAHGFVISDQITIKET